jgi:predicted metal-dependent phosphoesterase TrpH
MIDLHCHTTASDGLLTPHNLIGQAKKEGITILAIADHDTVAGIEEAISAAKENDISLIPAIELSLDFPTGDLHLLGYGIDYNNQDFINRIQKLKSAREERIFRIIKKLNKINIDLTIEDVNKESKAASPGKPHVARALVKKGYAADVTSAIRKYLNEDMPGYVSKEKLDLEAAFKLIRNIGGVPVLAHPKSMQCIDNREYERIIESFISYGLVGIEVYASIHKDIDVEIFAGIARRHNLITTGGSDFHGKNGDGLGYYGENRTIPISCAHSILRFINNK